MNACVVSILSCLTPNNSNWAAVLILLSNYSFKAEAYSLSATDTWTVWAEQVCCQTELVSVLILCNYPARINYNEPNVSLFLSSCLCLLLRAAVTRFQANSNWVSVCGFYWNVPQHIVCETKKTTKNGVKIVQDERGTCTAKQTKGCFG